MRTALKTILITLTLGTLLALDATPARAPRLLTNFGFDTGLASWKSCGTGTASFDGALDVHGSALSGSAKLVHSHSILKTCKAVPAASSLRDFVPCAQSARADGRERGEWGPVKLRLTERGVVRPLAPERN